MKNTQATPKFTFVTISILFSLFFYWSTVVQNREFLLWANEISLFLPTTDFFMQQMQIAGGGLSYMALFFNQFFYFPFVGSTILLISLLLISFLVIRVFNISVPYYPVAFIPSVALLASITGIGYVLYSVKLPGYLFVATIGIVLLLLFLLAFKNITSSAYRIILLSVYIVLSYPLFGVYTLLAGVLGLLLELKRKGNKGIIVRILTVVGGVLLLVCVPFVYSRCVYSHMPYNEMLTAALPHFNFNKQEFYLWLPFIVLFLSLIVYSVCFNKILNKRMKSKWIVSVTVLLAFLYAGNLQAYNNKNFERELQMIRLIETNDWKKVVQVGDLQDEPPTRLIILAYNLALNKLGTAGDQMFHMDNRSVVQETPRLGMVLIQMGAKPLYFQYGKINYCYRWCMEDMVEYGMSVSGLKYMVKCALLNNELSLAKKYLNVLQSTLFYKKWAQKYMSYINNPALIEEDEEFTATKPLMAYQNLLDGDNGKLEIFLLNSFAYMVGGTPTIVETSLQCNLVLKDIELFWPRYFLYARTHQRTPTHYQEAAILYSYLEGKVELNRLNIDQNIIDRFNLMINMSKQYANRTPEFNQKAFKPQFGNTFWYYYFFVTDIRSN